MKQVISLLACAILSLSAWAQDSKYSVVYIVGDATANAWDKTDTKKLYPVKNEDGNETYTWTGKLEADKGFKFVCAEGGDWIPSLNAEHEKQLVEIGTPVNLLERKTYDEPDEQFTVGATGYYMVTLNLSEAVNTMTIDYVSLYMVGGATENGWTVENASPMERDADNPNLFTWTGTLRVNSEGDERNLFKILGQKTWDPFSLNPSVHEEDILSPELTINERYNGSVEDHKWSINQDGTYHITVDLMAGTITATFDDPGTGTGNKLLTADDLLITAQNGTVEITLPESGAVESIELFNLSGKVVASTTNVSNRVLLGNNLPSGIYLVKVSTAENAGLAKKIIVK